MILFKTIAIILASVFLVATADSELKKRLAHLIADQTATKGVRLPRVYSFLIDFLRYLALVLISTQTIFFLLEHSDKNLYEHAKKNSLVLLVVAASLLALALYYVYVIRLGYVLLSYFLKLPLGRAILVGPVLVIASALLMFLTTAAFVSWRLASGPISMDLATPWLLAALEDNLGGGRTAQIGRLQFERNHSGHYSVSVLDMVIRDHEGIVLMSIPKAEAEIPLPNLLIGRLQATGLTIVGAAVLIRIEKRGAVTVAFLGYNPLFIGGQTHQDKLSSNDLPALGEAFEKIVGMFVEGLPEFDRRLGALNGSNLRQLRSKDTRLIIQDNRFSERTTLEPVDFDMSFDVRGLNVVVSSSHPEPWSLSASFVRDNAARVFDFFVRDVSAYAFLRAFGVHSVAVQIDSRISGALNARLSPDGALATTRVKLVATAGQLHCRQPPTGPFQFQQAVFAWNSIGSERLTEVPFEITAGGILTTGRLQYSGGQLYASQSNHQDRKPFSELHQLCSMAAKVR